MSNVGRFMVKDRAIALCLFLALAALSFSATWTGHNAELAARASATVVERSNHNSPIIALLNDCINPAGECAKRGAETTGKAIQLVTAQEACIVKESLGYNNLADRTPAEAEEIKAICKTLLGGDALDFLRRATQP